MLWNTELSMVSPKFLFAMTSVVHGDSQGIATAVFDGLAMTAKRRKRKTGRDCHVATLLAMTMITVAKGDTITNCGPYGC